MAVWADPALQMQTAVTANFGKQAVTAVCFCTVDNVLFYPFNLSRNVESQILYHYLFFYWH